MRRLCSMRVLESLVLMFGVTAVGGAQRAKTPPPTSPVAVPDIRDEDLSTIANRVTSLRVSPGTITIRVGQTVSLDSIKVIAVDAKGHDVGRLRAFNFGIKPGEPATAIPRQLTGVRPGKTQLRISYPSIQWGKRVQERPAVLVAVIIKP